MSTPISETPVSRFVMILFANDVNLSESLRGFAMPGYTVFGKIICNPSANHEYALDIFLSLNIL